MFEIDGNIQRLRDLLTSQQLAVLATSSQGQSYASLVAFVVAEDLKNLVFATDRTTRKFANLTQNCQVALLIDSRSNQAIDFDDALAVTAVGPAEEVIGTERPLWLARYLDKYPHLEGFVTAPPCALVRVQVSHYYLVSRFQQVVAVQIT